MRVSDIMTREVRTIQPEQSIREAAQLMEQMDTGALLVAENDRLVGMITDRDITIRAVANDCQNSTPIRDIMTKEIKYCFEDQDVNEIAENMAENQVRRMPVVSREKRLVGVVSLGNIASSDESGAIRTMVEGVSARH